MLISTKNKKNIAKSIALMLALVFAISCVLTACSDKQARGDIEDVKVSLDAVNKDVDALEGKVDQAATADDIAKALADYLKTADLDAQVEAILKKYLEDGEADEFVKGFLTNYITKDILDAEVAKINELLADFATKDEINGKFIMDAIAKYDGAKAALLELIDDAYLSTKDYEDATDNVVSAFLSTLEAVEYLAEGTYTKANWAEIEKILGISANVSEDEMILDTIVRILRATHVGCEVEGCDDGIKCATAKFEAVKEIENSAMLVDEINAMIKALDDEIKASEFKKITTAYAEKVNAIGAKIDAFYKVYTVEDIDYNEDKTVDVASQTANLVNAPAKNADYGINYTTLTPYVDTINALFAQAEKIDAMIVDMVLKVGQLTENLSDAQMSTIKTVIDEVTDFLAKNNKITDPILNYETYLRYEFIYYSVKFDSERLLKIDQLNKYAADLYAEYEDPNMVADIEKVIEVAVDEIEALVFASEDKTAEASYKHLNQIVTDAKDEMFEIYNSYSIETQRLAFIAMIEDIKSMYTDAKYATVVAKGDAVIADIKAVTVAEATEDAPYPYTDAVAAMGDIEWEGETDMVFMGVKIDACESIDAYVLTINAKLDAWVVANNIDLKKAAEVKKDVADTAAAEKVAINALPHMGMPNAIKNYNAKLSMNNIAAVYYTDLADIQAWEAQTAIKAVLDTTVDTPEYVDVYAIARKYIIGLAGDAYKVDAAAVIATVDNNTDTTAIEAALEAAVAAQGAKVDEYKAKFDAEVAPKLPTVNP